jgi:hypothetical protein
MKFKGKITKRTRDGKATFDMKGFREFLEEYPDGTVLILEVHEQRTLDINAALHAMTRDLAIHLGKRFDELKDELALMYLGVEKRFFNVVKEVEVDGEMTKVTVREEHEVIRRTSEASQDELVFMLQQMEIWAMEEHNFQLGK